MSPYITLVVAASNADYGGDFLKRMQVFINALFALWTSPETDMELVVVEWNPPEDRPLLRDALVWPSGLSRGRVRIIEVPREVHRQFQRPQERPMPAIWDMAKNVGIRRSRGEYVLATNPDLVYSMELIRFLESRSLSPDCFYRAYRYDVNAAVPADADVAQQLAFLARHVIGVGVKGANIRLHHPGKISWPSYVLQMWSQRFGSYLMKRDWRLYGIHTYASGDFTLMLRDHWFALRGYPELRRHYWIDHLDSCLLVMAARAGLHQVILEPPLLYYHQEHRRPWEKARYPRMKVVHDYLEWIRYGEVLREMLHSKRLAPMNDDTWGLADWKLQEYSP